MRSKKLRARVAAAATISVAALTATLGLTTGVAQAGVTVPPYPTVGVYPNWLTAGTGSSQTQTASNIVRGMGSDTTLFLSETISDLYDQAGLYGCNLTSTTNATCDDTQSNNATTDTVDNFDRTEVLQGINNVGSGNGQAQLCGTQSHPNNVDYARSSKPISAITGCPMVQLGFAKDSVPMVDFQGINPDAVGSPTFYAGNTYTFPHQSFASPAFPANIGPVAAGWEPGDSFTCNTTHTCSGTAFSDVDNVVNGTKGANSTAYRLWCASDSTRITDWGQLTNLSLGGPTLSSALSTSGAITSIPVNALPQAISTSYGGQITITSGTHSQTFTLTAPNNASDTGIAVTSITPNFAYPTTSKITYAVGSGTPIGVPVRITGINTGSGTVAQFSSFANAGVSSGGCSGSNKMDNNAVSGPDPTLNNGVTGNLEIAVENNASQIGDFALADFPNDPADQSVVIATSLYIISNGVFSTSQNAKTAQLTPGTFVMPSGVPTAYLATESNENGVAISTPNVRNNVYPTSRTLFNIYRSDTIKASTAGFLNWMCDQNSAFTKSRDINTGAASYDSELNFAIQNQYGFIRLNDAAASETSVTPASGVAAPNASCDANLAMTGDGTDGVLTMASGNVPSASAFTVGQAVFGTGIPSGSTITAVGTNTITISNTGPSGAVQVYFPGMAPILAVANNNS